MSYVVEAVQCYFSLKRMIQLLLCWCYSCNIKTTYYSCHILKVFHHHRILFSSFPENDLGHYFKKATIRGLNDWGQVTNMTFWLAQFPTRLWSNYFRDISHIIHTLDTSRVGRSVTEVVFWTRGRWNHGTSWRGQTPHLGLINTLCPSDLPLFLLGIVKLIWML